MRLGGQTEKGDDMKKTILFAGALAAMTVPTAVSAAPAQSPANYCKANPGLIGAGKVYANLGTCLTAQADKQKATTANAATTCKAEEKAMGVNPFAAKYSATKNKSNAFGKCVSQIVNAKTAEQQ